jgi:hypothetical protein
MKPSTFIATRLALVAAISSLTQACRTMSDVIKNKDEGTVQVYPVNSDQAWKIAMQVFRWEGADAIEEHRDQNLMLTSSGFNLVTAGTYMGAWVEPVDLNTT